MVGHRFSSSRGYEETKKGNVRQRACEEVAEQPSTSTTSSSNLDQFLLHTTPIVQAQYLPKTCLWVKRWRPANVEAISFFTLGDLWDTFDEWSAYGAGVPLVLSGKEAVVQYYVPYLSALQIYTRTGVRRCMNYSDYRDSNSEASSDNDSESSMEGLRPISTAFWKKCQGGFCRGQPGNSLTSLHECSSDDEDNWEDKQSDHLLLNYVEESAPFSRVPLGDKIAELARKLPEIRTLHSYELLPTSWFSVAWYPIYRIPMGPTLKDLGTCFLTFHSLSTPLQDATDVPYGSARVDLVKGSIKRDEKSNKLCLQSFGLASYKLRGAFWNTAGNTEKILASKLESRAESWLKGLDVFHRDFDFFAKRK